MSLENYDHIDPAAIRRDLANQRDRRVPFDRAWLYATRNCRHGSPEIMRFMEKHFHAAYMNDVSENGRYLVPERDVSSAIPVRDFSRAAVDVPVEVLPKAHDVDQCCKSGDGCDRLATHGWFGQFCEAHFEELDKVSRSLRIARDRANPRNGGNTSLYTHKAA